MADIDANFNVCTRGPATTTSGNVPVWDNTAGTSISTGLPTNPAAGTITTLIGVDVSNKLPAVDGSNLTNLSAGVIRSYIAGLTLSNDGSTPNSVLDVAAGTCADSTNAVMITLTAFTKSTAGSWTAGTGTNGMGVGLTIANSTWYHVFAIINTAQADVYFDTSVSAANKPVGTTAFRRIGSFLTDGSAHIIAFIQDGTLFQWVTLVADVSANNPGTSAVSRTLTVPTGVNVQAMLQLILQNGGNGGTSYGYLSDLATTDSTPSATLADTASARSASGFTAQTGTRLYVRTNTSAAIRSRISFSDANVTLVVNTLGWIDPRGANS